MTNYSKKLIDENKNLRAIWLQGSDKYKGALDAIKKANKQNEIALICFDAEPEFLEMGYLGTFGKNATKKFKDSLSFISQVPF